MPLLDKHYERVEEDYVHRSKGRMAHHSSFGNAKISDCYEAVEDLLKKILKSLSKDGSYMLGRHLSSLEDAFSLYNNVLKSDYTHGLMLWRGGSMGVSSEAKAASAASGVILRSIKKKIRAQIGAIRKIIGVIASCENGISLEKVVVVSSSAKPKSVKARRSSMVSSAAAAAAARKKIIC